MTNQEIQAEAVVAATKVLYADKMSNHSGDNAPQIIDACEAVVRKILDAAAPHMLAAAWAAGHESGFWNGRESTGSGEMEFCGVEHAKATNPYRPADAD